MITLLTDSQKTQEERLHSLQILFGYIESMQNEGISSKRLVYLQGLMECIIDAFESLPVQEDSIVYYGDLLKRELCPKDIFMIEGKGWFANIVRKYLKKEGYIIADALEDHSKDRIIRIICDEDSGVSFNEEQRVIQLWKYMKYTYFFHPEYWTIMNEYNFSKSCDGIKGVITGMSYFRDALKTEYLKLPMVTLANSSQDLFYDFKMFQKAYAEIGEGIQVVIIGLAPYSLRYDESLSQAQVLRNFAYFHEFDTWHNLQISDKDKNFFERQRAMIEQYLDKSICNYLFSDGYVPLYGNGKKDDTLVFDSSCVDDIYLKEIIGKYSKPYEKTLQENIKILREYLSYCKERNVQAYILIPPFSKWHSEYWKKEYYDEFLHVLEEIGEEYDFGLVDLAMEQWADYYFRDYAHLNRLGAIRVCTILNQILTEK